jgi:hypothetical protein
MEEIAGLPQGSDFLSRSRVGTAGRQGLGFVRNVVIAHAISSATTSGQRRQSPIVKKREGVARWEALSKRAMRILRFETFAWLKRFL